jgi:hypothetical protein
LAPTGPETRARWQGRDVSHHLGGEKEKPTKGIDKRIRLKTITQLPAT